MSDLSEKLGLRIKELRIKKGLKQCDLADKLNMERSNFTRIESGKQRPNDENLVKIAQALNVEVKDLFDFEHEKPEKELMSEIIEILQSHPERTKDFYNIIKALTK